MFKYDILTLDAKALMWLSTPNGTHPEYMIDLRGGGTDRNFSVISTTEEMGDSPFFDQIAECGDIEKKTFAESDWLYKEVIFVDFKDSLMFSDKRRLKAEIKRLNIKRKAIKNGKQKIKVSRTFHSEIKRLNIKQKAIKNGKQKIKVSRTFHSEIIRGFSVGKHLSTLLNRKYGIHIIFEDGTDVHFVPSDRSASMAKACKMAFINEKHVDALGKRLCLDMDFSTIGKAAGGIQLSKYYAYRGLYLTTSRRIYFDENEINENSLIVLKDFKDKPLDGDGNRYFTAKRKDNSTRHEFFEEDTFAGELNLYDGEGFICPEFTEKINESLGDAKQNDRDKSDSGDVIKDFKELTSIQLRGPFLKGMVHTVDFKKFFEDYGNCKDGKLMIKDAFGVERNLLEAKIIINESMFKCKKWLDEHCRQTCQKDPMKFYFEKYREYNHGLYVANAVNMKDEDEDEDDHYKENEKSVKSVRVSAEKNNNEELNYQFLSTLDFSKEDLEKLVEKHFKISKEDRKRRYSFPGVIYEGMPAYLKAARKNPLFLNKEDVKQSLQKEQKNSRLLCGRGKLKTYGEHRYLSSDLLAYMIDILKETTSEDDSRISEIWDELKKGRLPAGYFYAPAKESVKEYAPEIAFERNPHLSRQEEVVLSAFKPKKNSLYKKYGLDKLTDVVMFPRASLNFMILSSADMDGDIVKMYSDKIIVDAIKRGCYDNNNKRKLPIIIIPDEGKKLAMATKEGCPDIELLIDTFSNKVGKISNMAITFARDEYSSAKKSSVDNPTARCTILTGLEIDKAKHGFSVAADIRELERKCRELREYKRKDYFIQVKEKISGKYAEECTVQKLNDEGYILGRGENDYYAIGIKPQSEVSYTLDRLISFYAEEESEAGKTDSEEISKLLTVDKQTLAKYPYYFAFQKDPAWEKSLDSGKLNEIKKLMNAYTGITDCFRKIHKSEEIMNATNFHGKALYYLQKRYDDSVFSSKVKLLIESETQAEKRLNTYDNARNALERLVNEFSWPFIAEEEEREECLKDILGSDIPEDILQFLSNFHDEGYFLAYYIFRFVYYRLKAQRPVNEMISQKTQNKYKGNDYWDVLFTQLEKSIKKKYTYSKFLNIINQECRLCLDRIFPSEVSTRSNSAEEALPYIFSCMNKKIDKASFLWNVIPEDVLLDAIA